MSKRQSLPLFCCLLLVLLLCGCAGTAAPVVQKTAPDPQWRGSMQAGRNAYDQGNYLLAGRLYRLAVERGRQMDRSESIADAAFNLAATEIQLGDFSAANRALQEAKSESRRRGESLNEILLLEASIARLQAEGQRSRTIIDQLLLRLPATERRLRSQALLLSGQLACDAGDLLRAKQEQELSAALLRGNSQPLVGARRAELQGCISHLQQQPLAAATAFDHQGALLQQAHQYRQMVNALSQAGAAYAAAGQNDQAAERLFRAARSAFSQKRHGEARLLLEKAAAAARAVDAVLLLDEIARLQAELGDEATD